MQAADLPLVRTVARPTVHPDGTWAVVSVTHPDLDADATVGQLWRVPLAPSGAATGGAGEATGAEGEAPRRLTRGFHDAAPRFSPDGTLVAFLRAEPRTAPQLWVLPAGGGEAVQVTDRKLGVTDFRWSPDGTSIAFLSREPEPSRAGTVRSRASGRWPRRHAASRAGAGHATVWATTRTARSTRSWSAHRTSPPSPWCSPHRPRGVRRSPGPPCRRRGD